jgi:hypothetical protein
MSRADPTTCFASDYASARAAFRDACAASGVAVASLPHPLPGPGGESLGLDVARIGAADARRVLFLASGTHGVEGFCGSGIQHFLLRNGLAQRVPDGVALVLLHPVNPWGFAWLRRVNEDNVDVNRNFLDHTAPHPENADYDGLYDVLNPASLDDATVAASVAALQKFQSERGATAAYRALSGGQYRHARGLQYGGREPVWPNRALRSVWSQHAADAELAVNLDLHSGLGPCGVGLILQTAREGSADARLAKAGWPDVIRAEPAQGSDAALVSGLVGPAFSAAHPDAATVAVVVEFGTRDMLQVMLAVQADNWLHHYGTRDSEAGRAIEQRMRDAFFLEDDAWKEKVCNRADEAVTRALQGMAAWNPEEGR